MAEILVLILVGFLVRGTWDHVKKDFRTSRDQRMKEVAKSYPKGALPKSRRKAAARQHAAGWWAREARHGFPVTKTGWHAAWLAHKAQAHAHDTRREEAAADAAEAEVARKLGVSGARQRRAAAQAELDKIEAELAAQQAKGSPATGKRAVEKAADEVSRKRKEREQATGPRCPSCGAPEGYDHRPDCDPSVPPLPADSVPRQQDDLPDPRLRSAQRQRDQRGQRNLCAACGHPGNPDDELVISDGYRVHESHTHDPASGFYEAPGHAEDSAHLNPGEPRCEGCGGTGRNGAGNDACPVCRGWGGASVGPEFMSPAPAGTVCNACGRKGSAADPVLIAPGGTTIHTSHATEQHEAYAAALKRQYPDDGEIDDAVMEADSQPINPTASPTTQGAPVTDTNYTAVLAHADQAVIDADQDAVTAAKRRQTAEQHAEGMQAANVQGTCLTAQMELTELHKKVEEATKAAAEQATLVSNSLKKEHGGIQAAVDDAPIAQPAEPAFYGGS